MIDGHVVEQLLASDPAQNQFAGFVEEYSPRNLPMSWQGGGGVTVHILRHDDTLQKVVLGDPSPAVFLARPVSCVVGILIRDETDTLAREFSSVARISGTK
jgi:hypothetical protein